LREGTSIRRGFQGGKKIQTECIKSNNFCYRCNLFSVPPFYPLRTIILTVICSKAKLRKLGGLRSRKDRKLGGDGEPGSLATMESPEARQAMKQEGKVRYGARRRRLATSGPGS
jgi:hypothetical protein